MTRVRISAARLDLAGSRDILVFAVQQLERDSAQEPECSADNGSQHFNFSQLISHPGHDATENCSTEYRYKDLRSQPIYHGTGAATMVLKNTSTSSGESPLITFPTRTPSVIAELTTGVLLSPTTPAATLP